MIEFDRSGNSKYKPEYCDIALSLGKQGKSRMQVASILNIDRGTLNNWERQYPAFQRALARAMADSQAWWEAKAQQSLGKKQFQAQLWRYSMAGRFKEDYAEKAGSGLADALPDFLAAITEAAERRRQKALDSQAGDTAKPVEAQDVVLEPTKR
jgi:hypothetical protein